MPSSVHLYIMYMFMTLPVLYNLVFTCGNKIHGMEFTMLCYTKLVIWKFRDVQSMLQQAGLPQIYQFETMIHSSIMLQYLSNM